MCDNIDEILEELKKPIKSIESGKIVILPPESAPKQLSINGLIADEIFQSLETLVEQTEMFDMLNEKGQDKYSFEKVKAELLRMLSNE